MTALCDACKATGVQVERDRRVPEPPPGLIEELRLLLRRRDELLDVIREHIDPLERRVRTLIGEELGLDLGEVPMDASLVENLGADDLDGVEIVMKLEEAFGLAEIDEMVADTFLRVRDVVAYVRKHAGA